MNRSETVEFDPSLVLHGRLHVLIAMDVGEEIDLNRVAQMAQAHKHEFPRRPRTPSSFAYHPAPVRLLARPVELDVPGLGAVAVPGEVTLFDFGGMSVALRLPLAVSASALSALAGQLADASRIVATVRQALAPLVEELKPAIDDPEFSEMTEEYFVFELTPGAPLPAPGELIAVKAAWLAGLVRLDSGRMSDEEVAEALRLRLSYTPDDLFVAEWSAALLIDRECDETLEAIEFANLQLLEFRHTDQRLDAQLGTAYRLIHPLTRTRLPFWRTHTKPLRQLGDLRLEANSVFERTSNALKLIGDQYLARVYRLLGARFHLEEWQQSIERSLNALEDSYKILSDQAATFRAEFLEAAIVLLIVIEVVLTLIRYS